MMKTVITAAVMLTALSLGAAENDPVLATLEGKPIVASEVITPPVEKQLRDLANSEYDLKRDAIEAYIFQQVIERAAAKEGVPVKTLWTREVEAKAEKPTEEQIATVMQQNRSRLPREEAQARQIIERYLTDQLIERRAEAWRDELLAELDYTLLLEPVRYPVANLSGDAVLGSKDAPVTIVEFSDFQCPYCSQSQEVLKSLEKKYGESIRIVFKHLPLDIHPQARLAAEASLCADEQGSFRKLHDWLFANPRNIQVEAMVAVAPDLDLDGTALEQCISEKRFSDEVDQHIAQAQTLGVESTPTFFVNGRKVAERSIEEFSRLIDEELGR